MNVPRTHTIGLTPLADRDLSSGGPKINFWDMLCDVNTVLEASGNISSPSGYALDAADFSSSSSCYPSPPPSTATFITPEKFRFVSIPQPSEYQVILFIILHLLHLINTYPLHSIPQPWVYEVCGFLSTLLQYPPLTHHLPPRIRPLPPLTHRSFPPLPPPRSHPLIDPLPSSYPPSVNASLRIAPRSSFPPHTKPP